MSTGIHGTDPGEKRAMEGIQIITAFWQEDDFLGRRGFGKAICAGIPTPRIKREEKGFSVFLRSKGRAVGWPKKSGQGSFE